MKKSLIKMGAYFILIAGIIAAALILIFTIGLLISFPEASLLKRVSIIGGLFAAAIIVFGLALSIFESMHELLIVEDEIKEILARKKVNE